MNCGCGVGKEDGPESAEARVLEGRVARAIPAHRRREHRLYGGSSPQPLGGDTRAQDARESPTRVVHQQVYNVFEDTPPVGSGHRVFLAGSATCRRALVSLRVGDFPLYGLAWFSVSVRSFIVVEGESGEQTSGPQK